MTLNGRLVSLLTPVCAMSEPIAAQTSLAVDSQPSPIYESLERASVSCWKAKVMTS
jgi:hypothetical protein